jgi:hypothetical protein
MGEVHKARDTRLGRIVAVKVSQTGLNDRFERKRVPSPRSITQHLPVVRCRAELLRHGIDRGRAALAYGKQP